MNLQTFMYLVYLVSSGTMASLLRQFGGTLLGLLDSIGIVYLKSCHQSSRMEDGSWSLDKVNTAGGREQ